MKEIEVGFGLPSLFIGKDEDDATIVEWIFPGMRLGLIFDEKNNDAGWHVVSKEITASGPIKNKQS